MTKAENSEKTVQRETGHMSLRKLTYCVEKLLVKSVCKNWLTKMSEIAESFYQR